MKYTTPEVEFKVLESKDVITTSTGTESGDNNGGNNNSNNEFETPWD